ncbi:hypothetical protein [uncultured Limimaricola sp.]|uniref:DUF4870 family protein n=1 Tax=uncultured Limimaricola sp. TaxID=2211667 RepID=UPI0030F849BE
MTDINPTTAATPQKDAYFETKIVYGLFLGGLVFGPLALGALIYAYVARKEGQPGATHLSFVIRSCWFGIAGMVLGMFTALFLIGFAIVGVTWIWLVVRGISGIRTAFEGRELSDSKSLGFIAK